MFAPLNTLLVIKPGSFGDVIHALPCASAVKAHCPETRITWLVDERWQALLTGNPAVDQILIFPREKFRGLSGLPHILPWALRLPKVRPDVALDLQGLLRSALMARLSCARHTIGLADAREGARWFYDRVTPVVPHEHSVRRCLRSLDALGLPPTDHPQFPLPAGTPPAQFAPPRPFILLHPFARGSGKSLSKKYVLQLCRALQPQPVILAGVGELRGELPDNTVNLLGKTTLLEMVWLIRAADFVVSVDSGPMHIAAAVDAPLLSIHTWSDPRLVGPFNASASIWQGGEIRRQCLDGKDIPAARAPTGEDIARIARWVRDRVGG